MKTRHVLLILCFFLLLACQDKRAKEIERLVTEWQGKEIRFPEGLVFTRFISDTVNLTIPEAPYKVLVYVDSVGCTSCKLQLPRWKEFIATMDSLSGGNVPFLFIFQSNDTKEIRYLLKRDNFDKPISLDLSDRLNRLNHFPIDSRFQTFLLDRNNRVVLIGNPVHNPQIKELYINKVSGEKSAPHVLTTARIETSSIALGDIPLGESEEATFTLTNTGKRPLVITDVATTCGCAEPSFDKHPVQPGDSLHVKVRMTPKDKGFFNEVITVKCNTCQMIRFSIRGNAI